MNKQLTGEEPLLKVKNLKMYFPIHSGFLNRKRTDLKAVDDVTIEIYEGETFGLVGESGCGKTTVGKCILRILNPTSGQIIFEGTDIAKKRESELKSIRHDVQLIFQDPYGSLDPRQSANSMLKEVLSTGNKRYRSKEANARIIELLELVGLSREVGTRYPHELSGGQRQRLGIARALACEPKLIVCDEPVSALDVSIQAQIINLFKELQTKLKLTNLFIAHDLAVVRHIANRIGIMYLGEIVEVINSEQLYTHALHPYTNALLSAVPTTDYFEEKKKQRVILQGEVPSPLKKPVGCSFSPRCTMATEKCRQEPPRLRQVDERHSVSCHNV